MLHASVIHEKTVPARLAILCAAILFSCGGSWGDAVDLPDGSAGIGFDDLRYSSRLHRVLVPAGRTGNVVLVDPDSLATTVIGGFSKQDSYTGDHDFGATSVDEGGGYLFVVDRTSKTVDVVDLGARSIVATTPLSGGADYVRWVGATSEVWVSEPDSEKIEIFAFDSAPPALRPVATIAVSGGPESLVVDDSRHLAFTHLWLGRTVAIDTQSRTIVANWPNGCAASRGIAIDEARGFLLVGCNEGTATVLDVDHDGKLLSSVAKGSGFDVIGYNASLAHLYLAGSACGCLVTLGVSQAGDLSYVGREDAPSGAHAHCVTADDEGHAWVCDQDAGRVWRVNDDASRSGN